MCALEIEAYQHVKLFLQTFPLRLLMAALKTLHIPDGLLLCRFSQQKTCRFMRSDIVRTGPTTAYFPPLSWAEMVSLRRCSSICGISIFLEWRPICLWIQLTHRGVRNAEFITNTLASGKLINCTFCREKMQQGIRSLQFGKIGSESSMRYRSFRNSQRKLMTLFFFLLTKCANPSPNIWHTVYLFRPEM